MLKQIHHKDFPIRVYKILPLNWNCKQCKWRRGKRQITEITKIEHKCGHLNKIMIRWLNRVHCFTTRYPTTFWRIESYQFTIFCKTNVILQICSVNVYQNVLHKCYGVLIMWYSIKPRWWVNKPRRYIWSYIILALVQSLATNCFIFIILCLNYFIIPLF